VDSASIQQNGIASNVFSFKVTTTGTNSNMTLAPNLLNLSLGDTHSIQALSSAGQPIVGAADSLD
jgi:hypothetical protein